MKCEVISVKEVNTDNGLRNPIGQAFEASLSRVHYMQGMIAWFCLV